LRGQIKKKIKLEGSICIFLEIYWGKFENFEEQNAKFENLIDHLVL